MRIFQTTLMLMMQLVFVVSAPGQDGGINRNYLFGYVGTEADLTTYLTEVKNNRIATNIQSLSISSASQSIARQIEYLHTNGQRAVLILDRLLFLNDPGLNTPCGVNSWRQRIDYKAKFDNWLALNRSYLNSTHIAVIGIQSEVNNRCIPHTSLETVTQYIKSKVPDVPLLAGYGRSNGAQPLPAVIPPSLDGVAFFKYRTFDPQSDPDYQYEFEELKARLTAAQRIILVPDGFYDSGHVALGWPKWYLGHCALNYMNLALKDPLVIGLLIFQWPGFTEGEEVKPGTRDLPQHVRDRHREVAIGLNIQNPTMTP